MTRRSEASRRGLLLPWPAALAAIFIASAAQCQATELVATGLEQVLFDQRRDGCDSSDLPDAPARAFRNAAGQMVLFAPNYTNRAFVGADLEHLRRDCTIRFAAGGRPSPPLLDDRSWLQAFHTDDGNQVFAFASASFIPYRHGMPCIAGAARTDCWYNGLAALTSEDGGATFRYLGTPPHQIAFPPPEAYRDDVADPPGFMTATNMVAWDGWIYTVLWRRGGDGGVRSHNCLARAPNSDPLSWQVWSGGVFVPAATFDGREWQSLTSRCDAIGPADQPVIRGLVLDQDTQTFIAVFPYRRASEAGMPVSGFFYATSRDLVLWTVPKLLLAATLQADAATGESWAGYPSIIDETSRDRNFGTIDGTADLVFVRFNPRGSRSVSRQLVAVPLRIRD